MTTFLSSSMRSEDLFAASQRVDQGRARSPERQREDLKEACQQFEGILLSMLWKDMMRTARELGNDTKRPFGPLEDTAVEMASQSLSEGGQAFFRHGGEAGEFRFVGLNGESRGRSQGGSPFAPGTGRYDPVPLLLQILGPQQNDVRVPAHAQMLHAVVHEQQLGLQVPLSPGGGARAARIHKDRRVRMAAGQ